VEAIEAVLAIVEQYYNRKKPQAPVVPPAPAPAPPLVTSTPPLPKRQPPAAERPRAAGRAEAPEPLVPFAGAGPRAIVRAIIASEVLAPPLALRDES
jgi:hypothetical protein